MFVAVHWNEQYEVGDTRVDSQHKNLFEYVNRLEGIIERGKSGQKLDLTELENLVVFLDMYVNTHFAYEELCMNLRKCPAALQNKDAHNGFLEFWQNFQRENALSNVNLSTLEHLLETLTTWLTNHICKIDVQLRVKT
jgi:hemerythrin